MESYTFKSVEELNGVRDKFFTHEFLTGYCEVKGCTLAEYYKEFQDEIENFEVYNDDIWVTSFPKTGSTWTREIVWTIANDLKETNELLPYRFPHLEFCTIYDFRLHSEKNPDFHPLRAISNSINLVKYAKRPRFIKTHLPWDLLPKQIRTFEKTPKIVHVARNPKDTCVHYFHHSTLNVGYTGNFEDFWQLFITNKLMYTPYWDNILSYWNRRDKDNILFITYEDMKRDLPSVIELVAEFLNKQLSKIQMENLMERLNYHTIKNNRILQLEPITQFLKELKLCQNESGHFMRAGLIGNYRAQMCADVIDIYDKWTEENTKGTGLHFDISKYVPK